MRHSVMVETDCFLGTEKDGAHLSRFFPVVILCWPVIMIGKLVAGSSTESEGKYRGGNHIGFNSSLSGYSVTRQQLKRRGCGCVHSSKKGESPYSWRPCKKLGEDKLGLWLPRVYLLNFEFFYFSVHLSFFSPWYHGYCS